MTAGGILQELQSVPPDIPVHVCIGQTNDVVWREVFTISEVVDHNANRHVLIVANKEKKPAAI